MVKSKEAVKTHYLSIKERLDNFNEVNLGYHNLDEVKKECERCYQCFKSKDPKIKPPPCMEYCPTDCNSREIIASILNEDIDKALQIIYGHYPFPRSVERVCPGYCQLHCTAGIKGDPIQIPMIKRYLVDNFEPPFSYFECLPDNKYKIAIIGAGPLGLTVAYFLRKLGAEVTLFEKLNIIGGMMVTEIPEFRLPRNVLNDEIKNIKSLGIKIVENKKIDEVFNYEAIFELGYHLIVIGIGSEKPRWMKLPGEDSEIILQAIEFLKDFHLNKKIPNFQDKKVAVVGGGSTATDTARVIKRLGGLPTILYRRKKKQMPAGKQEVKDTEDEGIQIQFLTNPKEFICEEKEGDYQGTVCQKMELGEIDLTNRPKPVPIEGSEFKVEADYILEAIGQEPDLIGFNKNEFKISERNTFIVNEKFFTSVPKILAGGDCVSGSKSVVNSVAQGKKIAENVINFLKKVGN
ncbi:MAG: FAD-dependent oxidoreductase [Candidatus Lokiarchaeota archaeon]